MDEIEVKSNYEPIKIPSNFPKSNDWIVLNESQYLNLLSVNNQNVTNNNDEQQKICEIDGAQVEFEKIIGKGSFGQVWKGKWRSTKVAIKQVKQEIINEKSNN